MNLPLIRIVILFLAAAAVVGIAAYGAGSPENGSSDDDSPGQDPIPGIVYPEGVHVDPDDCVVFFDSPTDWTVRDLLSSYYVKERYTWVPYQESSGTGTAIVLGPGMYRIATADSVFNVVFPGTIGRISEWEYDMGGIAKEVSVTYSLDIADLAQQRGKGMEFNVSHKYLFSELPGLVSITDDIVFLESSLRSEFLRIGGDADDEQGYADFLASFVQCAITYPYRVDKQGEDYSLYGQDEYWASPLETLNLQYGDCEDKSILLCALYAAAGYDAAMGGSYGHVYCGVALRDFTEVSQNRLKELDPYRSFKLYAHVPVEGPEMYADTVYYAVETIYGQLPVGYLGSGTRDPGASTPWGPVGFYPYQGAESGIQAPS